MLIGLSDFLRHYGIWLLIALALAGCAVLRAGSQKPGPRRSLHRWQLRAAAGRAQLVRGFNTARFTRTLSILTAQRRAGAGGAAHRRRGGHQPADARAVAEAAARVREGAPIGRSLAPSRLFPPMTIHLISSGESSGELETMLERAALNQERELDGLIAALVGLLGPLLIVVHGPVRDGHRFCDAVANFRDEFADPLIRALHRRRGRISFGP